MEQKIIELRMQNMGYQAIANKLHISKKRVRYFCIKNNLGGVMVLDYGTKAKTQQPKEKIENCLNCNKKITHNIGAGRPKKFCCRECKRVYDNKIKKQKSESMGYKNICVYCNNEFNARHRSSKYCSDECKQNKKIKEIMLRRNIIFNYC